MKSGFIKLRRSENSRELLKRPKSFALLALIALRARRSDELNIHGLGIGEALLGDREAVGLTQQEYRSAKNLLEKLGLATFRGTNRGTIAKLMDCTIFDINLTDDNEQVHKQATNRQPPPNERATTNKNDKNLKNIKNEKKYKEYENFKKKFIQNATMPSPTYEDLVSAR
jgi:hypothetical protein